MFLRNQSFESTFIEDVDELLAVDHQAQLLEERERIVGHDLLNADALADSLLDAARLAQLHDLPFVVSNHLHLLLAQFMAVQGQYGSLCLHHFFDHSGIEEYVAVKEQEVGSVDIGTCEPQRIDIIGRGIVGIINEVDSQASLCGEERHRHQVVVVVDELTYHLTAIACHNDKLGDAGIYQSIHRALQQRLTAYF